MFSFLNQKTATTTGKKSRQGRRVLSPLKLYLSCDKLPLDIFLKCYVQKDLTALIIEGKATGDQLAQAWASIYYEYIDLSESTESKFVYSLQKEITLLSDEIRNVETCIFYLSSEMLPYHAQQEDLKKVLKGYNYKLSAEHTDQQLMGIIGRLAPKKTQLESRIKELENYTSSTSEETPTYKQFEKILLRLSKHQGYSIRSKDITVTQYALLLNDYIKSKEKWREPEK